MSVALRVGVVVVTGPTHCLVFIFACVVGICVFGKGILYVLLRDTYQSMCPFLWINVSSWAQGLFDWSITRRSSHSFFFYFCRRKIICLFSSSPNNFQPAIKTFSLHYSFQICSNICIDFSIKERYYKQSLTQLKQLSKQPVSCLHE